MTPLSETARKLFTWPPDLRHAPGPPDEDKGGFRSECRCGWSGKWVKASPSHAYQVTRIHADAENTREQAGGSPIEVDQYTKDGDPPRAARRSTPSRSSVGSSRASGGVPGTPCGCGCGEPSGGLFRPGHDSKLLSRLLAGIRAGSITLAEAHEEMAAIGTSEVLKEKLTKKVAA